MSEMEIVNAIIQYIQLLGGVAIRINSGMRVIQDSNGSTRAFRGAPAGTSDIVACLPGGKYAAIEVKTRRGKTTPAQDEFLQRVREAGGVGIVARSIEDVQAALEEARQGGRGWGMIDAEPRWHRKHLEMVEVKNDRQPDL